MNIKVVSSSLVKAEVETPKQSIWLPKLDLFQVRTHLATIYFYRPINNNGGDPGFFSPDSLRRALAKALVPFYPLAGRLSPTGHDGRLELLCSGEGVLFVHAESSLAIDDLGGFTPSPEKRKLLVPSLSYHHDITALPLVVLQITFFKCGGVCLGVGNHHTVLDGVSGLHFINTWSNIARGLDIAVPPFLDRTLLRAGSPPAVHFDHPEFKPNPKPNSPDSVKMPVSVAVLHLSLHNLNKIKNHCNAKLRYRTNEVVAAHVWRCACKARRLAADQHTRTFITVDGRTRLQPPLPPGYLGNVIFPAVVTAAAGDVLSETMEEVAARFRQTIERLDDKYLRSAIDWLEMQEDVTKIGRWVGEFPASDMSITSWTSLPIYGADFGWGPPEYVGPAMLFYAGLCYVMPMPSRNDGVRVAVSLEEDCMEEFKNLFFDLSQF